jgi:hypothetical protein
MVISPLYAKNPPKAATITKLILEMQFMIGPMEPASISALIATTVRISEVLSNSSILHS